MTIPTEADVTLLIHIYKLSAHILLHHLGHALSVHFVYSYHLATIYVGINMLYPCTFISCVQVRLE